MKNKFFSLILAFSFLLVCSCGGSKRGSVEKDVNAEYMLAQASVSRVVGEANVELPEEILIGGEEEELIANGEYAEKQDDVIKEAGSTFVNNKDMSNNTKPPRNGQRLIQLSDAARTILGQEVEAACDNPIKNCIIPGKKVKEIYQRAKDKVIANFNNNADKKRDRSKEKIGSARELKEVLNGPDMDDIASYVQGMACCPQGKALDIEKFKSAANKIAVKRYRSIKDKKDSTVFEMAKDGIIKDILTANYSNMDVCKEAEGDIAANKIRDRMNKDLCLNDNRIKECFAVSIDELIVNKCKGKGFEVKECKVSRCEYNHIISIFKMGNDNVCEKQIEKDSDNAVVEEDDDNNATIIENKDNSQDTRISKTFETPISSSSTYTAPSCISYAYLFDRLKVLAENYCQSRGIAINEKNYEAYIALLEKARSQYCAKDSICCLPSEKSISAEKLPQPSIDICDKASEGIGVSAKDYIASSEDELNRYCEDKRLQVNKSVVSELDSLLNQYCSSGYLNCSLNSAQQTEIQNFLKRQKEAGSACINACIMARNAANEKEKTLEAACNTSGRKPSDNVALTKQKIEDMLAAACRKIQGPCCLNDEIKGQLEEYVPSDINSNEKYLSYLCVEGKDDEKCVYNSFEEYYSYYKKSGTYQSCTTSLIKSVYESYVKDSKYHCINNSNLAGINEKAQKICEEDAQQKAKANSKDTKPSISTINININTNALRYDLSPGLLMRR